MHQRSVFVQGEQGLGREVLDDTQCTDLTHRAATFGGSGSTLIGCERRKRKARLMEIDPRYCDATVRRWQAYTGKQAKRDRDGRLFDAIKRETGRIAA